ncbi:hypothetical protein Bca4012_038492 [Brassica carinata]
MMSLWKKKSTGDDHSAGDTLCSECGLVLESHSIDETSEWRTFANESSNSDPNRVGGPTNPLLADSALTTIIAKTNGSSGDFLSNYLGRWQNRNGSAERGLIQAFKTIATMSDSFMQLQLTRQTPGYCNYKHTRSTENQEDSLR